MSEDVHESQQWRSLHVGGFMKHFRPFLAARTDSGWIYSTELTDDHVNALGAIHGGVITTLFDHVMALIAWEAALRKPVVTVQMDTKFLSPAASGDRIQVAARIRHQSRTLIHLEADAKVADGLVAVASAVFAIPSGSRESGQVNRG